MAKAKKTVKRAAGKKPPADAEGPKGVEMDFRIDDITYDPETQPREGDGSGAHGIYAEHVADLQKVVRAKKPLPRVRIWRVAGKGNFLTDGHQTTEAHKLEGRKTVPALVFEGEWWEAVADASGANRHNDAPLKLSHAEKRAAVKNLLKALKAAGKSWSNGRVAKWCDVSDDLVGKMIQNQPSLAPAGAVVGEDGKTYSKPKPKPEVKLAPKAEPKEVLDETGLVYPNPPAPPAETTKPRAPEPRVFDFAQFESHVGSIERDIDKLAEISGVQHTPRTEGIRRGLRDFKAAFSIWHKELGDKARNK